MLSAETPPAVNLNGDESYSVNMDSPEDIERALKKMEANDINFYRSLMKIRKLNFKLFMEKLSEWIKQHDAGWINAEKFRLGQKKRDINSELRDLAKEYKDLNPDSEEAELILKDIQGKASELYTAQIDQKKLAVYQKKIELASLETKLHKKQQSKEQDIDKLIKRFVKNYKIVSVEK